MTRLQELAASLGEDVVIEIIEMFAVDTRAHMAALRDAVAEADVNLVRRLAHCITGAARNIGARPLAERAFALEQSATTLSFAALNAAATSLQAALEETIREIAPST